jgi:hypothetical protein
LPVVVFRADKKKVAQSSLLVFLRGQGVARLVLQAAGGLKWSFLYRVAG